MDDQKDTQSFVREIHGRTWNKSTELYHFPAVADEAEWKRLSTKHEMNYIIFNGLLPCSLEMIDALLAPVGDLPKRVLDIGCGTGLWALEMAKAYPHVEVQGIDLVPVTLQNAPSNLKFSVVNVNHGLSALRDQYDLVHVRSMTISTTDFPKSLIEFQECLKPGGMLILIDGQQHMRDADERRIPMAKLEGDEDVSTVSEDGLMFERMFWEIITTLKMAGAETERSVRSIEHGLWDQPLLDPDTAGGGSAYIPVGGWSQDPDPVKKDMLQRAGMLIADMFLGNQRAWHVPFRRAGIPEETFDRWSKRAQEELRGTKEHVYAFCSYCWARRRASDGQPSPPLPEWKDSMRVLSASSPSVKYLLTQEYKTAEEARLAYEKRESSIGKWPTPYVQRFAAAQADSKRNQVE